MWFDVVMFLNHAEFRIQGRSDREIGCATFHIAAHGGFDPSKFDSTAAKVGPALDQLLGGARFLTG